VRKLVVALLAALLGTAAGYTWYVHPDSSLNSIQRALDFCGDGDTVLVAPDTWPAGYDWPSTSGIVLAGERGADSTVIDGNGTTYGFSLFNVPGGEALISGLTIANCTGPVSGGIEVNQASLLLRDCRLTGNSGRGGGAVSCEYGGIAARRCVFEANNSSLYPAGGLSFGNGCNALVESCVVANNRNGGISFSDGANTIVTRCNIFGNEGEAMSYSGSGGTDAMAENNWWGDTSGPFHPVLNPDGRGDTVSDWVDFTPWRTTPVVVAVAEPPSTRPPVGALSASIVRGLLNLSADAGRPTAAAVLVDILGRRALALRPGPNDVSRLAPGVYFVRTPGSTRPVLVVR
jgi:hypothetical protein